MSLELYYAAAPADDDSQQDQDDDGAPLKIDERSHSLSLVPWAVQSLRALQARNEGLLVLEDGSALHTAAGGAAHPPLLYALIMSMEFLIRPFSKIKTSTTTTTTTPCLITAKMEYWESQVDDLWDIIQADDDLYDVFCQYQVHVWRRLVYLELRDVFADDEDEGEHDGTVAAESLSLPHEDLWGSRSTFGTDWSSFHNDDDDDSSSFPPIDLDELSLLDSPSQEPTQKEEACLEACLLI